jgi:Cu2+-exporting ATPase
MRVGEDTTLSKIIQMVSDASATKAPLARIADKVSGIFVPVVIGIAVVTFIGWMIAGRDTAFSIARAISVLVISCPCALGLATPVAIMVGSGVGAKRGILYKTAESLEQTGRVKTVILDKTGTITKGEPKVTDVIVAGGMTENELLRYAASLEKYSEHPLAKAVVEYWNEGKIGRDINGGLMELQGFEALPGNGLKAECDAGVLQGGSFAYISQVAQISDDHKAEINKVSEDGKTPLLFALGDKLLGIIAVADMIKDDSAKAISDLKALGLKVVMLTGDNKRTAEAVGKTAGVDEVIAGVLPDGKESAVSELMKTGKVMMVGDGINDAPALTKADIGVAIGAGADVAVDAADVVLMKNSLMDVARGIRLSRATIRNIHENLFWAFFYNVLGIPLAAGCYVAAFGWELNPVFGAAAMGLSSFCVVSNALRLNLIRPYDSKRDKPIKNPITGKLIEQKTNTEITKENNEMKIKVNGMMCQHCEMHVKKALEAIDGIDGAVASHEENLVTITNSKDVDESAIKAAVEAAGYEYAGLVG